MNNEELATAVQTGQADILVLWGQVRRFAVQKALRTEQSFGVRGGVTVDDLVQAAFLALMDALERWKPDCGYAFLSYYGTCLKTAFMACCGMRSKKQDQDPLRGCISLDQPANPDDPDSDTLGNLQPDPEAELAIEAVAERDRLDKLRAGVEEALAQLPEDQQAAVRARYWYDCPPADPKALRSAMKNLRRPRISLKLLRLL